MEGNHNEYTMKAHAQGVRAWYKYSDPANERDKYIKEWDDAEWENPVSGETVDLYDEHEESVPYDRAEFYPLAFDIESDASTPQRPILAVAYDAATGTAWVAVDWERAEWPEGKVYAPELREMVRDEFGGREMGVREVNVHTLGVSWFDRILDQMCKDDEDDAGNEIRRALTGHNVFYDLGMLGGNNDWRLENHKDSPHEWDGVIEYEDWMCVHKRAGAYGRIYSFRQHKIPIPGINVADTRVVSKAARLPGKLEDLAEELGIEYNEPEDLEHTGELTEDYIRYCMDDVAATVEVYDALQDYVSKAFGSPIPLHKIFSSASIGKDALRRAGYDRAHYTTEAMDIASSAYVGGQTEALRPGQLVENVAYMDLMSQYPSASALTGVWEYMRAESVRAEMVDIADLPYPSADEMREKRAWEECANYYVSAVADDAVLPVRVEDEFSDTTKVHTAHTRHSSGVVYHWLDVLAAKLRGGDVEIKQAWRLVPEGEQDGINSVRIGETDIPARENIMRKCIEERKRIQYDENDGDKDHRTLGLKIVANSMYGITAERIVGTDTTGDDEAITRHDVAGSYYNPHCATTITAAGRMMLALGEIEANEHGGQLHYCDTDSLIVDAGCAEEVIEYFDDLNPYDGTAGEKDFLEIEDGARPVYDEWEQPGEWPSVALDGVNLFAVDVKKYVILDDEGRILKHTEHGLGHYKNLRNSDENPHRVRKFMASLIAGYFGDVPLHPRERLLSDAALDEIVRWEVSASTYQTRQLLQEMLGREVRYGDFAERTIMAGDASGEYVQFIGIDLDEQCIRIEQGEDGYEVTALNGKPEELDKNKRVQNIITQWALTAHSREAGRPHYFIDGTRRIDKEARDIREEAEKQLKRQLSAVLDAVDLSPIF